MTAGRLSGGRATPGIIFDYSTSARDDNVFSSYNKVNLQIIDIFKESHRPIDRPLRQIFQTYFS